MEEDNFDGGAKKRRVQIPESDEEWKENLGKRLFDKCKTPPGPTLQALEEQFKIFKNNKKGKSSAKQLYDFLKHCEHFSSSSGVTANPNTKYYSDSNLKTMLTSSLKTDCANKDKGVSEDDLDARYKEYTTNNKKIKKPTIDEFKAACQYIQTPSVEDRTTLARLDKIKNAIKKKDTSFNTTSTDDLIKFFGISRIEPDVKPVQLRNLTPILKSVHSKGKVSSSKIDPVTLMLFQGLNNLRDGPRSYKISMLNNNTSLKAKQGGTTIVLRTTGTIHCFSKTDDLDVITSLIESFLECLEKFITYSLQLVLDAETKPTQISTEMFSYLKINIKQDLTLEYNNINYTVTVSRNKIEVEPMPSINDYKEVWEAVKMLLRKKLPPVLTFKKPPTIVLRVYKFDFGTYLNLETLADVLGVKHAYDISSVVGPNNVVYYTLDLEEYRVHYRIFRGGSVMMNVYENADYDGLPLITVPVVVNAVVNYIVPFLEEAVTLSSSSSSSSSSTSSTPEQLTARRQDLLGPLLADKCKQRPGASYSELYEQYKKTTTHLSFDGFMAQCEFKKERKLELLGDELYETCKRLPGATEQELFDRFSSLSFKESLSFEQFKQSCDFSTRALLPLVDNNSHLLNGLIHPDDLSLGSNLDLYGIPPDNDNYMSYNFPDIDDDDDFNLGLILTDEDREDHW